MDPREKTNLDLVNALVKVFKLPDFFAKIKVTQVIRGARVPIIKFVSTASKYPPFVGDICVRNHLVSCQTCAVFLNEMIIVVSCHYWQGPRNTKMMNAYATFDERLRTLGYGIKKFAKVSAY